MCTSPFCCRDTAEGDFSLIPPHTRYSQLVLLWSYLQAKIVLVIFYQAHPFPRK